MVDAAQLLEADTSGHRMSCGQGCCWVVLHGRQMKDVDGGVGVGVCFMSAGLAAEDRLAFTVPCPNMSADGTFSTGVTWINPKEVSFGKFIF